MLHHGLAQYSVVAVEKPLAVSAARCGETFGLIGEKDLIGQTPLVVLLAYWHNLNNYLAQLCCAYQLIPN